MYPLWILFTNNNFISLNSFHSKLFYEVSLFNKAWCVSFMSRYIHQYLINILMCLLCKSDTVIVLKISVIVN